jgi:hypothetical protein
MLVICSSRLHPKLASFTLYHAKYIIDVIFTILASSVGDLNNHLIWQTYDICGIALLSTE